MFLPRLWLLPLAFAALSSPLCAQSEVPGNRPPTVRIDPAGPTAVHLGRDVLLTVTVDDPDGDRVSARLELGPTGMSMMPIVQELPPVVREIRWFAFKQAGGRERVAVIARDVARPDRRVRGEAALDIDGAPYGTNVRIDDLDRDGQSELFVAAPTLDRGGLVDSGGLLMFRGGAGAHQAPVIFEAYTPVASARLGERLCGPSIELVDVTGDGALDIVSFSFTPSGSIHVWNGTGNGPIRRSDATLVMPPAPRLHTSQARWLLFHDVTGDGIDDIVVVAPADAAIATNGGALHVFAGGPTLAGRLLPTATLRRLVTVSNDFLGDSGGLGQAVGFGDVTGDGQDDVIAAAPRATVNGKATAGVVCVWAGGSTLSGAVAPTAELHAAVPVTGLSIAFLHNSRSFEIDDVDGDGIDDLVVPAPALPAPGTAPSGGTIHVWSGGAALIGSPNADATLNVPGAYWTDSLAAIHAGGGLQVVDVTGDGQVDVVAATQDADVGGAVDAGAVFVWAGGPGLRGKLAPTATLGTTIAQTAAELASGTQGFRVADVTGDGVRDILTATFGYDLGSKVDAGALHVWAGGPLLIGTPPPTATLQDGSPQTSDALGANDRDATAQGFQLCDVTGDGIVEIIVPAPNARHAGAARAGVIHVFRTGPTLAGTVLPFAKLEALTPATDDFLGAGEDGRAILYEDVTGDGVRDVVAGSVNSSYGTRVNSGAVFVWKGGASLGGTVVPTASFYGRQVGEHMGTSSISFQCADLTGDEIQDLVIGSRGAGVWPHQSAGRGYLLKGGPKLLGLRTADGTYERPWASKGDACFNWRMRLAAFDADGTIDVFVPTPYADYGGMTDAGVIAWWPDAFSTQTTAPVEWRGLVPEAGARFGY